MASGLPNDTGHDFIHVARGHSECAAIKEDERKGDCDDVGDAYDDEEKQEKAAAYRFGSLREHRPTADYSNSDAPHGDCSRQSLDQIAACHGEADRQNCDDDDCEKTTFAELPAYVRPEKQHMQLSSLSERDDSEATALPEPPSRSARSSTTPSTTRRRRQSGCRGRGGQSGRRGRSSGKYSRRRRERSGSTPAAPRKTSRCRRPLASTSRMVRPVKAARERGAARCLPAPRKNVQSDAASFSSARLRRSSRCRSRSASRSKSVSRKRSRSRSASNSKRSDSATRRQSRATSRSGSRESRLSGSTTRRKYRAISRSCSRERRRNASTGRRPSRGRDPGKPKRPISAFILFLNEFRKENADKYRGLDVRDLTKIGGQVWRSMSLKKKCEYQQESNRLHDMYAEQMKQYRAELKTNTARRRPETAYQVFLRKFYSEHKNDRRCPTPRDVLIKGARKWRRMTLREKMPFMDFFEEDPNNEPKTSRSQEAEDLDIHFADECQHAEHAAPHSDCGCGPDEHVVEENDVHATPSMQLTSDNQFDRVTDDPAQHFVIAPPVAPSDEFVASAVNVEGKEANFASPLSNDMTAHRKTSGIMEFLSHRFRGDHYAGRR